MTGPEVFVSIILPTYQREELLCQTIKSLLDLNYSNYEIIIMDQSSSHNPETEEYLRQVQGVIRYFRLERPSLVLALNAAIEQALGDILLFVDDDITLPQKDFIQRHLRNYEDDHIAGVAGKVLDADNPKECEYDLRSQDKVWGFFYTSWNHNEFVDSDMAPGANMSFRRSVLLKVGGFDEAYAVCPARFEQDLCLRIKANGYRVVFDPSPTVHHYYNSPGGCENRNLSDNYSHENKTHGWYHNLFCITTYFLLVHMPRNSLLPLMWNLYRKYALNMPYFKNGFIFFMMRQLAFWKGVTKGFILYIQHKTLLKKR